MAYVDRIKIEQTDSVKVAEYQFVKPTVSMEIVLEPGDELEIISKDGYKKLEEVMKYVKKQIQNKNKNN